MATRAFIILRDHDGMKGVYLHNDGYYEHAGKILLEHYSSKEKVKELISMGGISVLDENIGEKIDFEDYVKRSENKQCLFYCRDRGEALDITNVTEGKDSDTATSLATLKLNFAYLYMYNGDRWMTYAEGEWCPLETKC